MHVLHHQRDLALVADDVEHRNHVRMLDPSGQPGLIEQHGEEFRLGGELRMQAFDGDDA